MISSIIGYFVILVSLFVADPITKSFNTKSIKFRNDFGVEIKLNLQQQID